ncbi:MAG: hypothetical protein KDA84_25235, partial [Planctomycetaceae bacterium]|nr:hypothetical protein [Planctomycetaceae bacterium]
AYGRAIKRPYSVEDGLSQLVRDGELWLRRLEVVVEFINEKSDTESAGKNLADALEGLLESVVTKKQRKALLEDLRSVMEEFGDVLTRMRGVCTPQIDTGIERTFCEVSLWLLIT